jgi:hypothetical protein
MDASHRISTGLLMSSLANTDFKKMMAMAKQETFDCNNCGSRGHINGGGDTTEATEHLYNAIVGVR